VAPLLLHLGFVRRVLGVCACLLVYVFAARGRAQEATGQPPVALPEVAAGEAPGSEVAPEPARDQPAGQDKPGRVFGVLPNYTTVDAAARAPRITSKQSFRFAIENSLDPYVFPFLGGVALIGAGQGANDYSRRYATAFADKTLSNFMTTAVLPSMLRQDPRYFQRGSGGFWQRAAYAATRTVATRSRSGRAEVNFSEIGGNGAAAAIGTLYYPASNRSAADALARWGMQILWDAASNELKEFWPDIRGKLRHE